MHCAINYRCFHFILNVFRNQLLWYGNRSKKEAKLRIKVVKLRIKVVKQAKMSMVVIQFWLIFLFSTLFTEQSPLSYIQKQCIFNCVNSKIYSLSFRARTTNMMEFGATAEIRGVLVVRNRWMHFINLFFLRLLCFFWTYETLKKNQKCLFFLMLKKHI